LQKRIHELNLVRFHAIVTPSRADS
jgi:hypothetical protein